MGITSVMEKMDYGELTEEIRRTMRRSARDAVQLGFMLRLVAEYPQRQFYWRKDMTDEYYFHLLEKGKKGYGGTRYDEKYRNAVDSETYLVEFLKNLQKKG